MLAFLNRLLYEQHAVIHISSKEGAVEPNYTWECHIPNSLLGKISAWCDDTHGDVVDTHAQADLGGELGERTSEWKIDVEECFQFNVGCLVHVWYPSLSGSHDFDWEFVKGGTKTYRLVVIHARQDRNIWYKTYLTHGVVRRLALPVS